MLSLPCLRGFLRRSAFSTLIAVAFSASSLLHGQSVTYTGSTPALDFGNVNVCPSGSTSPAPCSKTLALTYKVTAGGTLGTPKVVTVGAPNLDYTLAGGSTCAGLVTEGATCVVNATLAPRYSGERKGAVEIVDGNGKLLATTLIHGIGVGPQIAFDPAVQTTIGADPSLDSNASLAIDESGDIYVGGLDGPIIKYPSDGGTPITLAAGGQPLSLDGAGNIFSLEVYLYETPPDGGQPVQISFPGIYIIEDVAVDGSGDLFLLYDTSVGYSVAEEPAGGGDQVILPFTGLGSNRDYAETLAVDSLGDVFVLDILSFGEGPTHIYELPAGGSQVELPFTFAGVGQMAVDAAGDLFVGNSPQIEQVPAGAKAPVVISNFPVTTIAPGDTPGQSLAISSAGDVYSVLPDSSSNLVAIHRSQPPPLSFPETRLGSTSIPLAVQIQNIGNAALSLSGLSASGPFALVPGSGTPADCTASTSLAPGKQCNVSVTFTPESESVVTGTVTLSDNALNSHAEQVIALSGTIGNPPQAKLSTTTMQYGQVPYPTGPSLPLTITNTGGGTLTIAPTINGPSYKIASSTCGAGVAAGQSCTLQVEFAPVSIGYHDDILSLATNESLNYGPTTLTVDLDGLSTGVGPIEAQRTLQFGTITPDPGSNTAARELTIYNYGTPGRVTITTSITGSNYDIISSTCDGGVTAGHTCVLEVQFYWNSESLGGDDDTLTITPSCGGAPTTVSLEGITTEGDG